MATPKQIAANRRNAQKSRGPVTEEGKKTASQNALKHGLCRAFQVLEGAEKQEDFNRLVDAFLEAEKPTDAVERELVIRMAEHTWLAKRALLMQNSSILLQERTEDEIAAGRHSYEVIHTFYEKHLRYHAAHERAYRAAAKQLMERRKQRHLQEIGFVREKRADAVEARRQTEEKRKAETHETAHATAKARQQLTEIRAAKELAAILPDNMPLLPRPQTQTSGRRRQFAA